MNTFVAKTKIFTGKDGWIYVDVPKIFTQELKQNRTAWGMYPIIVIIGDTTWKTKLMMKKGGDFFIALKTSVRKKENIALGDSVTTTLWC